MSGTTPKLPAPQVPGRSLRTCAFAIACQACTSQGRTNRRAIGALACQEVDQFMACMIAMHDKPQMILLMIILSTGFAVLSALYRPNFRMLCLHANAACNCRVSVHPNTKLGLCADCAYYACMKHYHLQRCFYPAIGKTA